MKHAIVPRPEGRAWAPARRALALAAAVLLLAYASGCDTLEEPGSLTLPEITKTVRFEIDGSQLQPGQTIEVVSTNPIDLTADLQQNVSSVDEVVSARVTSATLQRVSPQLDLRNFASAVVVLRGGSQTAQVASAGTFPSAAEASLSTQPLEVASFVRRPTFQGVLRLTPNEAPGSGTLVVTVTLRFQVSIEGV